MATRTFRGATSVNWGTASNWSEGAVPTVSDAVIFDQFSSACTLDVSGRTAASINFSAYTKTITFDNTLTIAGAVSLASGMTISGSEALIISNTATLTSRGKTFPNELKLTGNVTYTLADSWTVGKLTTIGTNTLTINGSFNLNVLGDFTTTLTVGGAATIVMAGTGIWSNTSSFTLSNKLTINTTGTTTISGNVYYATGPIIYSGGTVISTGSTLNIVGNTTIATNGMSWNNITQLSNTTVTLSNNLTAIGNYSSNLTNTTTINGLYNFNIGGDLSLSGNSSFVGTVTIIMNGTGTWSQAGTGAIQTKLTINTTGITTVSGNIYYNTGTLTYSGGTIITTGNTLIINGAATLNTDGIIWNDVTIPLTGAARIITLLSKLDIAGNFTNNNNGTITLTGLYNINVGGNLIENHGSSGMGGTATIVMNGTGIWSNASTGPLSTNLTFNTTGTTTISGNVYYSTGALTYTTGTVITTGSTLNITLTATLNTNTLIWNNLTTSAGNFTITLSSNLNISGNLTINNSAALTINGLYNVNVGGDLTQANALAGTATIIMNGTGTWSNASTGPLSTNLVFNTNGIITISGTVYYSTNTIEYVAGNIIAVGSTINATATSKLKLWNTGGAATPTTVAYVF